MEQGGKWRVVTTGPQRQVRVVTRDEIAAEEREKYVLIEEEALEEIARGSFRTWQEPTGRSGVSARLGRSLRALGEMLRLAPESDAPHPLAQIVGPVWSTQQVEVATGTTRQNLSDLAKRHRAIRLRMSSGTYWWPTFQFRRIRGDVKVDPGIQALWRKMPHGSFDPWELAAWILSPRDDLDGRRPVDFAVTEDAVEREPLRSVVERYRVRAQQ
jgi:hypothetical protein